MRGHDPYGGLTMPTNAKRGPGRPRTRPPGAKFRGIWLTAAEYRAVQAVVSQMRASRPKK